MVSAATTASAATMMSAAASAAMQAESVAPDKEESYTEKTQEEESPEFIEVPQEGIIVDDTRGEATRPNLRRLLLKLRLNHVEYFKPTTAVMQDQLEVVAGVMPC